VSEEPVVLVTLRPTDTVGGLEANVFYDGVNASIPVSRARKLLWLKLLLESLLAEERANERDG